ncbi:DUF1156 domain-containing protein [Candidatus Chloroploca sp. Khr17]|uniref:DUF1156 domain-containing protein n=1 Tax=Candidatus Chloroploca sp. Khr17 TaxID=2496869 RepID=UPI0013EB5122|nr:DUF1156 domain-containing protein [Candidatus Chloroploca sp. Khr17]
MTSNPKDRRIIEVEMPLTSISQHSAREKSIRHGHLSTLHIWWARRPLAACRAAIFAALVPQSEDPKTAQKMQLFLASLADWDNSLDQASASGSKPAHHYIRDARAYIKQAFPDRAPRVLDPFAGGGAIPLEALRLGCETYALDLNPVAHIIQLATLVYPQLYAHRPGSDGTRPGATLIGDVQKWAAWVLAKAHEEIGDLYPRNEDGAGTVAYLWARTITCPRVACAAPVPLIRQTWLAKKPGRMYAYKIECDGPGSAMRYTVIGPVKSAHDFAFDPAQGTTRGGTAVCPCCGTPLAEKHIKAEAQAGRMGDQMVAVVWQSKHGKLYRSVRPEDRAAFEQARMRLQALEENYDPLSGELPPVPDEVFTLNSRYAVPPMYGLDTFGKLFNSRQALALATLVKWVRAAYAEIARQVDDMAYAQAITTYLSIAVDRLADYNSSLCRWAPHGEYIGNTFSRQALPMMWDYTEVNPFSGSTGDWRGAVDWITRYIEHGSATSNHPADVRRGSATTLPYADNYFDAVITDPPYYDNVPYSDLSDFFYVWLRRTVGDLFPTVLGTPLTPKDQEVTQDISKKKGKADFERMLASAFAEITRVLREDGICVVVYAHKAISAWETLVAALLNAGLTVDGSWPFSTEMANRLRGQNSAALASSIFLVCRKRKIEAGIGIAGEVRTAIAANVRERLDQFWAAGLRGADFFISAIGPATAAFSRYDSVRDLRGNAITVSTLLEWVQQTVADYALSRVFASTAPASGDSAQGLGVVDDETRFYVLWRWTYDGVAGVVGVTGEHGNGGTKKTGLLTGSTEIEPGDSDEADREDGSGGKGDKKKKIPFGDAHLMATALGADVNALIHRFQILDGRSDVLLLNAAERDERIPDLGERRADGSRPPLIDMLHRCELLWAANMSDDMADYLSEFAPDEREALRRVAQALIDILPRGDLEKQRLEGFLYSGAAQQSGEGARPAGRAPIQQGMEGFEVGDKVLRDKRKRYGRP